MNNPPTSVNKPSIFSKEILRFIAVVLLCIVAICIISLSVKDENAYYNYTLIYIISILLFIIIAFSYIITTFDPKIKTSLFIYIGVLFAIVITITIITGSSITNLFINNYVQNILLFLIICIALVIFYYMFLEKIASKPGWVSFIINFIFYIPCIVTDGIKFIFQDMSSGKSNVSFLLFMELIIISIYFYFYPRLQNSVYDNGVILLKSPLQLNKEVRIDAELYKSFANKKPLPDSKVTMDSPIRQTYSLSMWIYLNIQPKTQYAYTKESTIFAYTNAEGEGHPKITYQNNENGIDQYVFYLSSIHDTSENGVPQKHIMNLPHQKWNNIVFNYRDLYVDIFINGNLEVSIPLQYIPKYTNMDKITIGENGINNRTGLYGSICNVVYYKNIMTKGQIVDNYNLLSIRNPPVN